MSSITDEIKARVDLVELIGRSVALRRSGASYRGLCPFHQEKTPSFYVFPQSHTWVCFGCGKKGSAFDWLMEHDHLDFGEALRALAQSTGLELPAWRDPRQEESARRSLELLAQAQTFYQGLLLGSAGAAARRYLAGRGVADATVATFGLGYAPAGSGLLRYLTEARFSVDEMVAAGVAATAEDGRPFDFFRDRVIFPIRDLQGRTVAFGGRCLGDGTPKYLNSRDTPLFHKQETLFAIDLARKPMAQERRAVVVEGYMDALMAHQHGYRDVLATLGTAVTERHLRLLRRLVDEVVLALDSDAAGQAATWRALQVAEQSLRTGLMPVMGPSRRQRRYVPDRAVQLRILTLPGAKDPDELIRADPPRWAALVRAATPVIDFVLARLEDRHDLATAQGKAAAADEVAEVLEAVADPIEQTHYIQQVAQLLKVGEGAVRQALRRRQRGAPPSSPRPAGGGGPGQGRAPDGEATHGRTAHAREPGEGDRVDEYALALLIRAREALGARAGDPLADGEPGEEEFALPESRALLRAARSGAGGPEALRGGLEPPLLLHLERVERFLPIVARFSTDQLTQELREVGLAMRKRSLLARKEQLKLLLLETVSPDEELERKRSLSELAHAINAIDEQLEQVRRPADRVGSR